MPANRKLPRNGLRGDHCEPHSLRTTLLTSRLLARVTCPDCSALSVDSSCPSKLLRLRRFEDVSPDQKQTADTRPVTIWRTGLPGSYHHAAWLRRRIHPPLA